MLSLLPLFYHRHHLSIITSCLPLHQWVACLAHSPRPSDVSSAWAEFMRVPSSCAHINQPSTLLLKGSGRKNLHEKQLSIASSSCSVSILHPSLVNFTFGNFASRSCPLSHYTLKATRPSGHVRQIQSTDLGQVRHQWPQVM